MGGRGGSMGGSHGMGGGAGGGAAKAAAQAAPQTREQQLLAQIKNDPTAILKMSDRDAADTVAAIEKLPIATDGTERDCFIQRYMDLIGWSTNKPTVLDDKAYETARKQAGEKSLYHSVKNYGGKVGTEFNQQLMTGKTAFSFEGLYGAGTYWVHDNASSSANYGPHQVKAFLNSKAKVVSTHQLRQEWTQTAIKRPRLFAALSKAKRGSYGGDEETIYAFLAASKGYNVIVKSDYTNNSTARRRGQYVITLDRSATTMSGKTISNASRGMQNW